MPWTKMWDGLWYNDTTGEQRATTGDPNQEDAAAMQQKPQWMREGWQIVSGDASGSGVSNTSVINPTTGKAESLIQVASAPDANGIKQDLGTVPYSEFVSMKSADPSIVVARALPSPEDSMLKSSLGSQIMEGIKEAGPIALAMYTGGPALSNFFGGAAGAGAGLSEAALAGMDAAQFGTAAAPVSIGGSGLGSSVLNTLGSLPNPTQLAGGTYGGNTTMTDVVPQINYGLADTGMLGNGLQLPSGTTPEVLGMGGANPQSNMGFNTAGVNTGANSTIGQGFNVNAALPTFGGTFSTDGITVSGANPAVNLGTGGVTPTPTPTPTPAPTGGFPMPPAPILGAGALAATAGLGGNTVTSGGDVDLTGIGSGTGGTPTPSSAESNSAIAKILAGTATADDWAKVAGQAIPGLLGAYANNQQSNTLQGLADRYAAYGAPSRARYEASMTPGFDPTMIAGYKGALDTASDTLLRRLSATGGNPYGNPGGLIEANKQIVAGTALPAIQDYQRMNAGTGGLANLAAAYPQTQNATAGSNANIYNSLGIAAADIFNPSQSLNDLLKSLNTGFVLA